MFDCVLPTRTARMGTAFSSEGRLNLKNARFKHDQRVLDEHCDCPACAGGFTRAYIHHLVRQGEMLGGILLSQHNIRYLLALMERVRAAIAQGRYEQFYRDWMDSPAANDF